MSVDISINWDIRGKLIEKGIPAEEIAFIHDADTDAKKKELFAKVRRNQVRVLLALLITFGVAPLVNRFTDQKVDIERLEVNMPCGQIITADCLEIVNVEAYNLPSNVIKDGKAVVGKYAATDLYARDHLFDSKLIGDNKSADDVLLGLGGDKFAISVNVSSFAAGLSDKLENGDIVSAIIYDKDMYASYTPAELKYIKVITTTTGDSIDKDEIDSGCCFCRMGSSLYRPYLALSMIIIIFLFL